MRSVTRHLNENYNNTTLTFGKWMRQCSRVELQHLTEERSRFVIWLLKLRHGFRRYHHAAFEHKFESYCCVQQFFSIVSEIDSKEVKKVCINNSSVIILFRFNLFHGPACIAFLCSPSLPSSSGWMIHFAKTWLSLQTTTYISKSTKYFDILLLLRLTLSPICWVWMGGGIPPTHPKPTDVKQQKQ